MPTYQYACTACDHAFEQVQSFSEDSLTVCPECQGRLRKVYNAVGVVFKGSGFYKTDSRNGAKGTKGGSASESTGSESSGSDSSGSDSSGSDSKGSGSSGSDSKGSSAGANSDSTGGSPKGSSSSSSSGTASSKVSAAT
ncbi:FmdB family transcriptional regulator [Nocardioidaceae bacterium]|nr:FmdB family transcriptional regulator [Nocardioidaceae bacterium]